MGAKHIFNYLKKNLQKKKKEIYYEKSILNNSISPLNLLSLQYFVLVILPIILLAIHLK